MKNETANQYNYYERQLIHCFQMLTLGKFFRKVIVNTLNENLYPPPPNLLQCLYICNYQKYYYLLHHVCMIQYGICTVIFL